MHRPRNKTHLGWIYTGGFAALPTLPQRATNWTPFTIVPEMANIKSCRKLSKTIGPQMANHNRAPHDALTECNQLIDAINEDQMLPRSV